MVPERHGKRYTSKFKFQVILEILRGTKNIGQIARSYGVHPITVTHWKREFLEKGPEIFGQKTTLQEYEKRVEELERLIGHKEVEIALLKNSLAGAHPARKRRPCKGFHGRIWSECDLEASGRFKEHLV